ncbi:MAG: hypothetical protein ACRDOJ_05150, partial [Nocardioidaceae bacterium]
MSLRVVTVLAATALAVSGGTALAVSGLSTAPPESERSAVEPAAVESVVRHEPGEAMLTQRVGTGVPRGAYQRAAAQARQVATAVSVRQAPARFSWRPDGPTNIGGRLVDVALDPADRDTVYVAAAGGGVWKSTDAGRTFDKAWPDSMSQAVGALAM